MLTPVRCIQTQRKMKEVWALATCTWWQVHTICDNRCLADLSATKLVHRCHKVLHVQYFAVYPDITYSAMKQHSSVSENQLKWQVTISRHINISYQFINDKFCYYYDHKKIQQFHVLNTVNFHGMKILSNQINTET